MRIAGMLLALAVSAAPFTAAVAQSAPAAPQSNAAAEAPLPCDGKINIVRVSEIKPGMMAKFLQAVDAQKAWYSKQGGDDEIGVMRIMEQNPRTKEWKISDTKAMTTHVMPAHRQPMPHDADWDAFVAMFSASSQIQNTYFGCMESAEKMQAAQ